MGEILTLPVPETLHGVYAVAVPAALADPVEVARERVTRHVAAPLRDLTLRMLDSPMLTVDLRPAAEFPPLPTDLLAAFGADRAQLAAIDRASHILAVRAGYQPGWPPAHEWSARTVAGALAAAGSGLVVDVFTPRVLAMDELWRSLPDSEGRIRLIDWLLIPHQEEPAGFWFTTKGLGRFGLPELQTEAVPAHLIEQWGQLLNGLARRLLDVWLERLRAGERPPFVELPEALRVGAQDVAAAYGTSDEMRREVTVRLRYDVMESESLLTVLPPDHRAGRTGQHFAALCSGLFGEPLPRRG